MIPNLEHRAFNVHRSPFAVLRAVRKKGAFSCELQNSGKRLIERRTVNGERRTVNDEQRIAKSIALLLEGKKNRGRFRSQTNH